MIIAALDAWVLDADATALETTVGARPAVHGVGAAVARAIVVAEATAVAVGAVVLFAALFATMNSISGELTYPGQVCPPSKRLHAYDTPPHTMRNPRKRGPRQKKDRWVSVGQMSPIDVVLSRVSSSS